MIRPLVHDTIFLKIRAKDADAEDVQTAKGLAETLEHHKEGCVGMAANMIGVPKRIIVFYDSKKIITMFNPEITGKNQPYETEEGCLSLLGGPRSVTRYKSTPHNLTPSKIRPLIVMKFDLSGVLIPRSLTIIVADLYNRLLYFGHYSFKFLLAVSRVAAEYSIRQFIAQ